MNYTFTIRKADAKRRLLGVTYSAPGQPEIFKNFTTDDFSLSGIRSLVQSYAKEVRAEWVRQAGTVTAPEVEEGVEYTADAPAELIVRDETVPAYDEYIEKLVNSDSFDPATNTRTISLVAVAKTEAEILERIAEDRAAKEVSGATFNYQGTDYLVDTSEKVLARISAARASTDLSDRKIRVLDPNGDPVFVPANRARIEALANLIEGHIEKCYEAEEVTVTKIRAGDLSARFSTEFDAL